MSYTAIVVAGPDGELHDGRVFRNSWGGAAFVWDMLWRTYLDPPQGAMPPTVHRETANRVWALIDDPRLSVEERITLATTFDFCLIHRADCLIVAQAFEAFVARYERRRGDRACNLPLQALYLRELAHHPEVREIGWRQTSVAGSWYSIDHLDDEEHPYNVRTDTGHWFLFEQYPDLLKAQSAVTLR